MAHSSARVLRWALVLLGVSAALSVAPELALLAARPETPGNLAADARLSSSNTAGLLEWLVRGEVPEEGSSWQTARVVLLGDGVGRIALDFGEPVEISALLVQADRGDEYTLRVSQDGVTWGPGGRVPTADGVGLRTRRLELSRPVRARYLELRNSPETSGQASAISALRVYAAKPEGWARAHTDSVTGVASGFPWLDPSGVDVCKVVLAVAGAFLLVTLLALDRRAASLRSKRLLGALLVAVSLVSALGWWNFLQLTEQKYDRGYYNYWDVYHYYLGSKYSRELGYTNLYRCHLAADVEAGLEDLQLRRRLTRDLVTNDLVPTPEVLAESAECRERFSPRRWAAFERDHAWFRSRLPPAYWMRLPQDHGYNPSPVWTILGSALSNLAPPMSDRVFVLLSSIDTLLLVAMWLLVFGTFGWRPGCAALVFFAANLVAGNHFTAGAFLRQDWLFLTVAGICCLKRERMGLAGFLLIYAALLRIFPVFLLLGVAFNALADMWARRSFVPSEAHRRFALGASVGLLLLVSVSFGVAGRATVWNEFTANIAKHHATPQVQNVGVSALVHHIDKPEIRERPFVMSADLQESYASPWRRYVAPALALLFLPLLVAAIADEQDWVAAILGVTWLPFVTDINNYYWSMLLVFGLLIVRKPIITAGFGAITVLFGALGLVYGYRGLAMFTWSSLALVLFFLWVAILFAAPKWRRWRSAGGYSM